ncbi:MAG: hypothetical protein WA869_16450 [Alloacidobacterium sp.]
MSHSPFKRRSTYAAGAAQQSLTHAKFGDAKGFAANRAQASRLFGKIFPAGIADGNAGEAQERFAAQAAWSREERAAETVYRTSQHASDRSPC